MTRTGYDSVSVDAIPADAELIFGYANGRYANVPQLRRRFPAAVIASIAVSDDCVADVLDVERFDATPEQAPGWALRMRALGRVPYVYCSGSAWPGVRAQFAAQHVPEPGWGIADYDGVAVIPDGADWKQYRGNVPPNYDVNIVVDYLPGIDPQPKDPDMETGDPVPFDGTTSTTVGAALGRTNFFTEQNLPRILQAEQAIAAKLDTTNTLLTTLVGLLTPKA